MDFPHTFGWPIWVYFWLGGVAGGMIAVASVANLARPGHYRQLGWLAALLGLPLLAVGLVLLVLDLGRPERFLNLLTDWNPSSPMWWGTWVLGISVAGYALFLADFAVDASPLQFQSPGIERVLVWTNLIVAGALVIYTGVLLAQTSRPLWNSTWLIPALFTFSALSTGVAALSLATQLRRKPEMPELPARLRRADVWLIVLELVVVAGFVVWLRWLASPLAARSADVLLSGELAPAFWIGVVAIGLVVPLLLELARGSRPLAMLAAWAGPALVLIGGLILRYAIITGGQIGTFV